MMMMVVVVCRRHQTHEDVEEEHAHRHVPLSFGDDGARGDRIHQTVERTKVVPPYGSPPRLESRAPQAELVDDGFANRHGGQDRNRPQPHPPRCNC